MTTHYVQFEDDAASRDDRMYDAATMLDRLASFFHEDGYAEDDWRDRCEEAWQRILEDAV